MFHHAFQGEANRRFIKGLSIYDHIYDSSVHFGRIIPIVQSSGTGKSRLVDEIGHEVCFSFSSMYMIR
jgi:hypothetical protein